MKRTHKYLLSLIMSMALLIGMTFMANAASHNCGGRIDHFRVCTEFYKGPVHTHKDDATGATYSCRVYTYVYTVSDVCSGCGYTVYWPNEVQSLHVAQ